jgi:Methyltransferase domain/Glycosyl transferase family 2
VKVVGVLLVRNEVDVIEANLRHHFASVLDEAVVIDNGSTDGTLELVDDLGSELPIHLSSEPGLIYQSDRVTRAARYASSSLRADWVLPIDADEFWVGLGVPFREVLEEASAEVRALFVDVVNFVQSRDVLVARPGCLATMTMRPTETFGPPEVTSALVQAGEISWVEAAYTPKCVHRAAPDVFVPRGNHLTGVPGGEPTDRLACLHAPLRARSVLAAKADQGRRVIEEGSSIEAGWQLKRWWAMTRAGTIECEWEALSHHDGTLELDGRRRELVADARLHEVAEGVNPHLRADAERTAQPTDDMPLAIATYYLALDDVPGWLDPLDFRLLVEADRVQRHGGLEGDLFEIGAYRGKCAILLGHLARWPQERLTVCDVFEHGEDIDEESFPQYNHWYGGNSEKAFLEQYARFHDQLPDVIVGPSEAIDVSDFEGSCRVVHVDGSHKYDIVRQDIETARRMLRPGGIVAFDDFATPHNPGSALAIWELVLSGRFTPLCITTAKLYGTWSQGGIDWTAALDAWVARTPDVGSEVHTLAGWPVRRIYAMGRPPVAPGRLVRIPDQ